MCLSLGCLLCKTNAYTDESEYIMHVQTVTSSYTIKRVHTCEGFAAVAPVGREDGLGLRHLAGEPLSTLAAPLPFELITSCDWLPIPPCSLSDEVTEMEGALWACSTFSSTPKSISSTPPFKSSWGEECLFLAAVSFSFKFNPCGDFLAERLALGLDGDLATREGGGEGVLVHVLGLAGLRTLVREE